MKKDEPRKSAIEMSVLGFVWKREPCTAYVVMKMFARSTSDFYKSKAGTIYPVVARLVKTGELTYADDEPGSKGDRLLKLTPLGLEKIRSWLMSPMSTEEVAHSVDLVRLRTFYLGTLEPAERVRYVEESLAGLQDRLANCEASVKRYTEEGDPFGAIAARHTIHETHARIAWLQEERENLLSLPSGKPTNIPRKI